MREIKFRAWHKTLGKMLYPPGKYDSMTLCRDSAGKWTSFKPRCGIEADEPQFLSAHMTWDGRWYQQGELQDVEWLQFTGLMDKNGKEIYEGDIVKTPIIRMSDRLGYTNDIVHFSNGIFCIREIALAQTIIPENRCEIIGNIFENPELLK